MSHTLSACLLAVGTAISSTTHFRDVTGGVYKARERIHGAVLSGLAYYRHSDWVGSSRLASTAGRTIYSDGAYGPFGETYAGNADPSFTGMNPDTVSNLYDFPAREYNGIQGRWPSPDPAGISSVDPTDPQTWNRYAYVRNNPLALTDPTGMDEGPGGGVCDPGGCLPDPCGDFDCPVWGAPTNVPPSVQFPTPNHVGFGLAQPIFPTGPGVDYSWLGLLQWAGIANSVPGALNWNGGCPSLWPFSTICQNDIYQGNEEADQQIFNGSCPAFS